MLKRLPICGFLLLLAPSLRAGEVIDRVVASVNGQVILQSDWDDELHYEGLMSGKMSTSSLDDRKAALDRLVDQLLVQEQPRPANFDVPTPEQVEKQLQEIRSEYVREHSQNSWSETLSRYGLTESELRTRIALELTQLKLIDARLRPSVQVDERAVTDYYNRQLMPELRRSGSQPPTLQEATPQIREILIQQKINEALPSCLEGLRSQAQIRVLVPDSGHEGQGQ